MFTQLSSLLPQAVASHGLSARVRAVSLREQFIALVAERWGASAAHLVTPRNVEGGVLLVEVKSSALAQELMLHGNALLYQLSQDAHMQHVARIRTILR